MSKRSKRSRSLSLRYLELIPVQARNRRDFIEILWRRPAPAPKARIRVSFSRRGRPVSKLHFIGIAGRWPVDPYATFRQ